MLRKARSFKNTTVHPYAHTVDKLGTCSAFSRTAAELSRSPRTHTLPEGCIHQFLGLLTMAEAKGKARDHPKTDLEG